MSYLIVSDSSSNILQEREHYKTVPLHVMLGTEEWIDLPETEIDLFEKARDAFKGKTASSCPSPDEWVNAFGDAETVFCVTISSGLSGSYNAAIAAKHIYEEHHPGRVVYVLDSLATGPRMVMMISFLEEQIAKGTDYETAYRKTLEYRDKAGLLFTLESIQMLANAGRVSPLIAKAIGILDMRIVGEANQFGKIELAGKYRGYKKALLGTFKHMLRMHYNGGKVVISHTKNETAAQDLAALIREQFSDALIDIHRNTVLCSYYAEKGGYIIGFETAK